MLEVKNNALFLDAFPGVFGKSVFSQKSGVICFYDGSSVDDPVNLFNISWLPVFSFSTYTYRISSSNNTPLLTLPKAFCRETPDLTGRDVKNIADVCNQFGINFLESFTAEFAPQAPKGNANNLYYGIKFFIQDEASWSEAAISALYFSVQFIPHYLSLLRVDLKPSLSAIYAEPSVLSVAEDGFDVVTVTSHLTSYSKKSMTTYYDGDSFVIDCEQLSVEDCSDDFDAHALQLCKHFILSVYGEGEGGSKMLSANYIEQSKQATSLPFSLPKSIVIRKLNAFRIESKVQNESAESWQKSTWRVCLRQDEICRLVDRFVSVLGVFVCGAAMRVHSQSPYRADSPNECSDEFFDLHLVVYPNRPYVNLPVSFPCTIL